MSFGRAAIAMMVGVFLGASGCTTAPNQTPEEVASETTESQEVVASETTDAPEVAAPETTEAAPPAAPTPPPPPPAPPAAPTPTQEVVAPETTDTPEEVEPETADASEWQTYDVLPGQLTADFPAEPQELTQPIPGTDLTATVQVVGTPAGSYASTTFAVPPEQEFDMDASVDGSLESALTNAEAQLGESGTIELTELTEEMFNEHEARQFTAALKVGDVEATLYGQTVRLPEHVVVLSAVVFEGSGDDEAAQRFVSSLAES